jgi:hypothetical protein
MTLRRLRASLDLDWNKPVPCLSGSLAICTAIGNEPAVFTNPNPPLATVLAQHQDAVTTHQLVGTGVHGAFEARALKLSILRTSMESERMMVQTVCDGRPAAEAANIIKLAGMKPVAVGALYKPLLGLKNAQPSGTVLLDANAKLLDASSRQKVYNWQYTLNGGQTFLGMTATPGAKTSIANLVPLTTVGFEVSVTVLGRPQSAWSPTVFILVR